MISRSPNFIRSTRVNVHTPEKDIEIRFIPLGTLEDFEVVGHSGLTMPSNFSMKYPHLMFPNQGFIIYINKVNEEMQA
jgi:hypothetical protein